MGCDCPSRDCPPESVLHPGSCAERHPHVCGRCGTKTIPVAEPLVDGRKQMNKAALTALTCDHETEILQEMAGIVQVTCGACFMILNPLVMCPACDSPATTVRGIIGICTMHSKLASYLLENAIYHHQTVAMIDKEIDRYIAYG